MPRKNSCSRVVLSPFRYPGGKSWFIPTARKWLKSFPNKPKLLIDLFAGGASVGLAAALEDLADHVLLVELDPDVAAVWEVILSDRVEDFCRRIEEFTPPTYESVSDLMNSNPTSTFDRAFRTYVRNRTYFGGIVAEGKSNILRKGDRGKGLMSRWSFKTIIKRIKKIAAHRDHLSIICADGLAVVEKFMENPHAAIFIDPPYTAAGKKAGKTLYAYCDIDHSLLMSKLVSSKSPILITYDDQPDIENAALQSGLKVQRLPMKTNHHSKVYELVIGRDLSWLDEHTDVKNDSCYVPPRCDLPAQFIAIDAFVEILKRIALPNLLQLLESFKAHPTTHPDEYIALQNSISAIEKVIQSSTNTTALGPRVEEAP